MKFMKSYTSLPVAKWCDVINSKFKVRIYDLFIWNEAFAFAFVCNLFLALSRILS